MFMLRESLLLLIAVAIVSGCVPPQIPREALQLSQASQAVRKLQSRRFETKEEQKLLGAGAAVLQEMGFTIDGREAELGLITGSKKQSAYNVGEIAASAAVAIVTTALQIPQSMPFSREQWVRASVVTKSGEEGTNIVVRVTLQRVVWDTEDKAAKSELLKDPETYQVFFDKLSKAVSLEAHE